MLYENIRDHILDNMTYSQALERFHGVERDVLERLVAVMPKEIFRVVVISGKFASIKDREDIRENYFKKGIKVFRKFLAHQLSAKPITLDISDSFIHKLNKGSLCDNPLKDGIEYNIDHIIDLAFASHKDTKKESILDFFHESQMDAEIYRANRPDRLVMLPAPIHDILTYLIAVQIKSDHWWDGEPLITLIPQDDVVRQAPLIAASQFEKYQHIIQEAAVIKFLHCADKLQLKLTEIYDANDANYIFDTLEAAFEYKADKPLKVARKKHFNKGKIRDFNNSVSDVFDNMKEEVSLGQQIILKAYKCQLAIEFCRQLHNNLLLPDEFLAAEKQARTAMDEFLPLLHDLHAQRFFGFWTKPDKFAAEQQSVSGQGLFSRRHSGKSLDL